eukprot:COSAG02_NODE_19481_length_879_cov_2.248718_1_plen_77_part_10
MPFLAPPVVGPVEYALAPHLQCSACRICANRCRTFQTDAAPRTDRPAQPSDLLDLCTDTNQPQLADPGAAYHGPLEY